jgi:hypothetical protein
MAMVWCEAESACILRPTAAAMRPEIPLSI